MKDTLLFEEEKVTKTESALPEWVEKRWFEKRTVFLQGDIEDDSISTLVSNLRLLDTMEKKSIRLYITSEGGNVYSILTLYDAINKMRSTVDVHVDGSAFSAAAVICACCSTGKRSCGKNATFMIHQISSGAWGKIDDMKDNVKESERLQKLLVALLAKHTKVSVKDLNVKLERDFYFDSKQAKKMGFVDVIR